MVTYWISFYPPVIRTRTWTSKVLPLSDAVADLYEQYAHDLGNVLDKHTPLVSSLTKKDSADRLSGDYRRVKSLRHQFDRPCHRVKNLLNRSWFCRQIALCNAVVNKDKSDYYSKLISDNSHDSRKLWRALHKTLNKVSDVKFQFHEPKKSLADQFAYFFQTKLRKLETPSLPQTLQMKFILLLILQKLPPLVKFPKKMLIK